MHCFTELSILVICFFENEFNLISKTISILKIKKIFHTVKKLQTI